MKKTMLMVVIFSVSVSANSQTPGTLSTSVIENLAKIESNPVVATKLNPTDLEKRASNNEYTATPLQITPEFTEKLKASKNN